MFNCLLRKCSIDTDIHHAYANEGTAPTILFIHLEKLVAMCSLAGLH